MLIKIVYQEKKRKRFMIEVSFFNGISLTYLDEDAFAKKQCLNDVFKDGKFNLIKNL